MFAGIWRSICPARKRLLASSPWASRQRWTTPPSALDAMLKHMVETYGFTRAEAMVMASLTVQMRITQVVNQVAGYTHCSRRMRLRGADYRSPWFAQYYSPYSLPNLV
jgi:hypothetical protein